MQLDSIYCLPGGILVAADANGAERAGCVGLRPLAQSTAEIRRMFVRPAFRGQGLGRRLVTVAIDYAKSQGTDRLVLNTLPQMAEAIRLYSSIGFVPIKSYLPEPTEGVLYFGLDLRD